MGSLSTVLRLLARSCEGRAPTRTPLTDRRFPSPLLSPIQGATGVAAHTGVAGCLRTQRGRNSLRVPSLAGGKAILTGCSAWRG